MILVRVKGGLGNQLFQYALARRLCSENKAVVKLDISDYAGGSARAYALDRFRTVQEIATPAEVKAVRYRLGMASELLRKVNRRVLKRTHLGFEPRILAARGNAYLDGYWQDQRYFLPIRQALCRELTLQEPLGPAAAEVEQAIRAQPDSVSLHIRRGDYLALSSYAVCSPSYYLTAIARLGPQLKQPAFFVFSDDIAWAKENLSCAHPLFFVSRPEIADYEEFALMGQCRHHIIANSTFSWWAAWLNQSPDKCVIAPGRWLAQDTAESLRIVPPDWTRLDAGPHASSPAARPSGTPR